MNLNTAEQEDAQGREPGAPAQRRFPSNCPNSSSLNANVKFAKEFFHLVSTIQITPLTRSLCSAAQSDRLPPPGSIRRDPRVVPAAGSCLAPSMTLTALLLCVGCATFIPCFSLFPSQTFLSLLLQPSYEGKGWGCPHHLPHGEGNTVSNVSTSFLALVWKDKWQVKSWRLKASLANPSLQDIPKDGMLSMHNPSSTGDHFSPQVWSLQGDARVWINPKPSRFLMQTSNVLLVNTSTALQPQTAFLSWRQRFLST